MIGENQFPSVRMGTREGDLELEVAQMLQLGLFERLTLTRKLERLLERSPGAAVLRRYEPGDLVVVQGTPGSSAFYILSEEDHERLGLNDGPYLSSMARLGSMTAAEVFLAQANPPPRLLERVFAWLPLARRAVGGGPAPRRAAAIPSDSPVHLSVDRPIGALQPGELFGELACMSSQPRAATVAATRVIYMLELARSVFEVLQSCPNYRERLEASYRQRGLRAHLEQVPLLSELPSEALDLLVREASLVRFAAGEQVFAEGDHSDAVYMIRSGLIAVRQRRGEVTSTTTYLGPGDAFGEIGLLQEQPRSATCVAYAHEGSSEASYVDVVRLDRALLLEVCRLAPALERRLQVLAERRVAQNAAPAPLGPGTREAAALGLLQGERLLVVDEERCVRCDACIDACRESHADGRARLTLEGPRYAGLLVPRSCRQCLDPVCMTGCPVSAIRRGTSGETRIESWCIGCGACARSCPYGAIEMAERQAQEVLAGRAGEPRIQKPELAVVCDQCADLRGGPRCVASCAHGAARRINGLLELTGGAGGGPC
ncbi:MAG: cyclic nucleotide-binding domain-containing protein [Planctomycetota bacterium]